MLESPAGNDGYRSTAGAHCGENAELAAHETSASTIRLLMSFDRVMVQALPTKLVEHCELLAHTSSCFSLSLILSPVGRFDSFRVFFGEVLNFNWVLPLKL